MPEEPPAAPTRPKAFISYSWTTPTFSEWVRGYADRLVREGGVEVILDRYDLREGDDKNAFMERMVTDPTVTHVLIFSDQKYAKKANDREGGVGVESLIISQKIYSLAKQSKFIPIFCEKDEAGEPYVPVFMGGRIGFDFSTPEKENENWEPLVRALHGKPAYQKPELGKPPAYILADHALPTLPAAGKFAALKQAISNGRGSLGVYRTDFLDTCIEFADALRVRANNAQLPSAEEALEDYTTLVSVRNALIDWVMLECGPQPTEEFRETLVLLLESLLRLAARPKEVTSWQPGCFAAMETFVCETVIYIVAALLKNGAYSALHDILTGSYLVPETEVYTSKRFQTFDSFYGECGMVGKLLQSPEGHTWLSPTAELFKRNANRRDLPFSNLMEADLLIYLMSILRDDGEWFPQTMVCAGWSTTFAFFIRATQRKGFMKLAKVTGWENAGALRDKVTAALSKAGRHTRLAGGWGPEITLAEALNLANLDTIA